MGVLEDKGQMGPEWRAWWCDAVIFDALIGNTDRHQDNWGLLWPIAGKARMAPAFDNGTSLGHEIAPEQLAGLAGPAQLRQYIGRGTHHIRWEADDDKRLTHQGFVKRLCEYWPNLRIHARERLAAFDVEAMDAAIMEMTGFAVPVPLTNLRATLICQLTKTRYSALMDIVGG